MNSIKIYFTIEPSDAGFTDQLLQFSVFYKLGLSLEYHYLHTPFYSRRSQATGLFSWYSRIQKITRKLPSSLNKMLSIFDGELSFNVHDFLGINQYFELNNPAIPEKEATTLRIDLCDEIIVEKNIDSFKDLQGYIVSLVDLKSDQENSIYLIYFRLKGKRLKLFSLVNLNTPHIQQLIDLREIYSRLRPKKKFDLEFENSKLRILLHIRQGDTSIIETPWKTWIPVDSRREDYLRQYKSLSELDTKNNFQPSDYNVFLRGLISYLDDGDYSIRCFSDGYALGLKILMSNADKIGLNSIQIKSLRRYQKSYEEKTFREFYKISNTRCIIGEASRKLRDLINSTLNSDILITSSQQRMIPKLASLYCKCRRPLVIVLYKDDPPDYSDITIDHNERFTYIDINNPNYNYILNLMSELNEK